MCNDTERVREVTITYQPAHVEEAALPPIPSVPNGVTNIDQLAHALSAATRRRARFRWKTGLGCVIMNRKE